MKTFLLILGIVLIVAGIISLGVSALFFYARMHTYDGSHELFARQTRTAFISLLVGIVLLVAGVICLVIKTKL